MAPALGTTRRRRRALWITVCGVLTLVLLAAAAGAAVYLRLDGNLAEVDIDGSLDPATRPPDGADGSLDLLVIGSDSRAGENARYGGSDGEARADTTMIVHLHNGRRSATVVSIPRDTLVPRPECERPDGTTAPAAARAMFNESYTVGGPVCAVKTVEALTGVRMDHYLEIDFAGFEELIDTLGGVELTLNRPLRDSESHVDLPAGRHRLDGAEALALVRTRKTVGDGSDLGRIRIQQDFLRALAAEVRDIGLLSSPARLLDVADAATSAITTDSGLGSVSRLTGLARTLRAIGPDQLRLVTLPVGYDTDDPNRVVPLEPAAERVWTALRQDRRPPERAAEESAAQEPDTAEVVE